MLEPANLGKALAAVRRDNNGRNRLPNRKVKAVQSKGRPGASHRRSGLAQCLKRLEATAVYKYGIINNQTVFATNFESRV